MPSLILLNGPPSSGKSTLAVELATYLAAHDRPAEIALAKLVRENFQGVVLLNGGFDQKSGEAAVASGLADGIVYGRLFIANPDLVERFRLGDTAYNPLRVETLYGGGAAGYTDYPKLVHPETAAVV